MCRVGASSSDSERFYSFNLQEFKEESQEESERKRVIFIFSCCRRSEFELRGFFCVSINVGADGVYPQHRALHAFFYENPNSEIKEA